MDERGKVILFFSSLILAVTFVVFFACWLAHVRFHKFDEFCVALHGATHDITRGELCLSKDGRVLGIQ